LATEKTRDTDSKIDKFRRFIVGFRRDYRLLEIIGLSCLLTAWFGDWHYRHSQRLHDEFRRDGRDLFSNYNSENDGYNLLLQSEINRVCSTRAIPAERDRFEAGWEFHGVRQIWTERYAARDLFLQRWVNILKQRADLCDATYSAGLDSVLTGLDSLRSSIVVKKDLVPDVQVMTWGDARNASKTWRRLFVSSNRLSQEMHAALNAMENKRFHFYQGLYLVGAGLVIWSKIISRRAASQSGMRR
jgi:hypothetical protein